MSAAFSFVDRNPIAGSIAGLLATATPAALSYLDSLEIILRIGSSAFSIACGAVTLIILSRQFRNGGKSVSVVELKGAGE
jgi:hypothetical protein